MKKLLRNKVSWVYVLLPLLLLIPLSVTWSQLQTFRYIINDVWDKANNRLMTTTGVGAQGVFETETTIFNNVWDSSGHFLRTSGGSGGGSSSSSEGISVTASTYGAVADAIILEDGTVSASSTAFTSATAVFVVGDVGKTIAIPSAGTAGATHITTIAARISATAVTLTNAAVSTVSAKRFVYGTENTVAFQAALNAAAAATVNTSQVIVPKGNYLFTATGGLTVPPHVDLVGATNFVPVDLGYIAATGYLDLSTTSKPMDGQGSTLAVFANEGTSTGQFLYLSNNASARGFTVFHPSQLRTLSTPKTYPWAVRLHGSNVTLENVQLVNPYQGIYSHYGNRHLVRNVHGMPLLTGLYASQQLDTSRYENISWVQGYDDGNDATSQLRVYMSTNLNAFVFGRVDNALGVNLFSFSSKYAFSFVTDASETTSAEGFLAPGGSAWFTCTGCGADGSRVPIYIVEAQGQSAANMSGINFTNGQLIAYTYSVVANAGVINLTNAWPLYIEATFTGRLSLNNMTFSLGSYSARIAGSGVVNISNSGFGTWSTQGIQTEAGSTTSLLLSNNEFHTNVGNSVKFLGTGKATLTGNKFAQTRASAVSIGSATVSRVGNIYTDNKDGVERLIAGSGITIDTDVGIATINSTGGSTPAGPPTSMFGFATGTAGLTLTNNTLYIPVVGGGATTPSTTEADAQLKSPIAAVVSMLQVTVSPTPTAATSIAFTLRKAGVDTALTCSVASGVVVCQDITHTVTIAVDDLIDVKVVSTGAVISAPNIIVAMQVSGIADYVEVTHSATQALTAATPYTVLFNTEIKKTVAGMHSTSSNTSRLVATTAGVHDIRCNWYLSTVVPTMAVIQLVKTVSAVPTTIGGASAPGSTGYGSQLNISRTATLAVGDYVECQAYYTGSAGVLVDSQSQYSPIFSMRWVGP